MVTVEDEFMLTRSGIDWAPLSWIIVGGEPDLAKSMLQQKVNFDEILNVAGVFFKLFKLMCVFLHTHERDASMILGT
jgi:hypothetical protein